MSVCIPAYRAAAFVDETVRSVLAQTHADLRLLVAIDPCPGERDLTRAALEPFLADPRVSVTTNPVRLGWAENVQALLQKVATPYYAILPHDDLWAPDYVETLLGALVREPDASVAYADLYRFGSTTAGRRKSVLLPAGEDRATHLLRFLLQGAEAMPWRGVTRTHTLSSTGGFPADRHRGFAVESEYATALLGAGRTLHVSRVLYFKRIHPAGEITASRERLVGVSKAERRAGWEEHNRRMTRLVADAARAAAMPASRDALCRAALDAAMVRRFQLFVTPDLGGVELRRASSALALCARSSDIVAPALSVQLHLLLRRHWQALGDGLRARHHAEAAWASGPPTAGSALAMAETLEAEQRHLEALGFVAEAVRLGPEDDSGASAALTERIYRRLGWSRPPAPPAGPLARAAMRLLRAARPRRR